MSEIPFRILHREQHWSGMYWVECGRVHVSSAYGSDDMALGRRRQHAVAGEILFGLVDDWCQAPRAHLFPREIGRLTDVFKFQAGS